MLHSIDRALAMFEGAEPATKGVVDLTSLFEGFDPVKYEVEAEERWGDTDAFEICRTRSRQYTERTWQTLREEQSALGQACIELAHRVKVMVLKIGGGEK